MRQPKPLTRHGHREAKPVGNKTDGTLHRQPHHPPRRSSGSMLARKYRNPWPTENDFSRDGSTRPVPRVDRADSGSSVSAFTALPAAPTFGAGACSDAMSSSNSSVMGLNGPKGYTREELVNFWSELSLVAKRRLLRIRRETYLTALDQFLVGKNLCCECHDNIIAEWEDHERKRSSSRSLQDVFSVFPPFLDDEDEDDDEGEENDEAEEEDEETGRLEDESDEDMLAAEDIMLGDEELLFKYELEGGGRQNACGEGGVVSNEYLAALEVGKRQEDELMRLIQKEERYIIVREDHTEFIMDLIRCGEQFSYVSSFRSGLDDDESEESNNDDDDDVDDLCPGANTSHLAQEYILEVLAIKFREQLEDAYQEALQHSLAIQAELLRDELADLKASQQPSTSSRKKKNKKEKKRRKKEAAAQKVTEKVPPRDAGTRSLPPRRLAHQSTASAAAMVLQPSSPERHDPEGDEVDREVEQFRQLLEKLNTGSALRSRKKLVLPPGSFLHATSMTVL